MNDLELSWKVIDWWVEKDYTSKDEAIGELGNLDDLVLRILDVIQSRGLKESDGMTYISNEIDMALF